MLLLPLLNLNYKIQVKSKHKIKKILVKVQINIPMMNLIQYLEAKVK